MAKEYRIGIYSESIQSIPKSVSELMRINPNQSEKNFDLVLLQIA